MQHSQQIPYPAIFAQTLEQISYPLDLYSIFATMFSKLVKQHAHLVQDIYQGQLDKAILTALFQGLVEWYVIYHKILSTLVKHRPPEIASGWGTRWETRVQ